MHKIQKSAILPYAAEKIFQLVNDIEKYPDFLPWCREAVILTQDTHTVQARLLLSKGGMEKSFTTVNSLTPSTRMIMELVDGPFKHLKGIWDFQVLSDHECQVALDLEFEFSSKLVAMLFGPVFQQAAHKLVDAFVDRADELYGHTPKN